MQTSNINIARVLAFTITTLTVFGYPVSASMAAEAATTPEEITVYTKMSLRKLRLETNRAQEAMFNVFNEANGDDRLDIHCDYVKRTQSQIREYICEPIFLKNAKEQEVNLFLRGIGGEDGGHAGAQGGGAGMTQVDYFNALLQEKMESVYQEDPAFRDAMNEYNVIREIYSARLSD